MLTPSGQFDPELPDWPWEPLASPHEGWGLASLAVASPIAINEYTLICSCGLPDPPFFARLGTGIGNERQPRGRDQGL